MYLHHSQHVANGLVSATLDIRRRHREWFDDLQKNLQEFPLLIR